MTSAAAMCVRVDDVTPHHWTRTTDGSLRRAIRPDDDRTTTRRRRKEREEEARVRRVTDGRTSVVVSFVVSFTH